MKYQSLATSDGSPSLRNFEVDEPYHSKAGAYKEAYFKYSDALKIHQASEPVIFDVCFGLGYNTAAAIDYLEKHNQSKATFYCFENDVDILNEILKLNFNSNGFNIMKKAVSLHLENKQTTIDNYKFFFIIADAREEIKRFKNIADYVFFDPFSPKTSPEMWERQFLNDVYNSMKEQSSLATYSYARVARDNLQSSGFELSDGPTMGRRSPSTIAIKKTL